MKEEIRNRLFKSQQEKTALLNTDEIVKWFKRTIGLIIPEYAKYEADNLESFSSQIRALESELEYVININQETNAVELVQEFFDSLWEIKEAIDLDARAIFNGDPAAKSHEEVRYSYPSLYAISAYRIANKLDQLGVTNIPRIISEYAHGKTGIDIHPSARIGKHFFIDHGTGVVIGETSEIGDHVKIYQGVTLGALSVSKSVKGKRHPSVGNNVVIYSGATILGGRTSIGDGSIIGGNVWLVKSVPPASKVYYQTPRESNLEKAS